MATEPLKNTLQKGGVMGPGAAVQPEKLAPRQQMQAVKDKLARNRQTQLQKSMEFLMTGKPDEHSAIYGTLKDVMKNMKDAERQYKEDQPNDIHADLQKIVDKYRETSGANKPRLPVAGQRDPRTGSGKPVGDPRFIPNQQKPPRSMGPLNDMIRFKGMKPGMPNNPIKQNPGFEPWGTGQAPRRQLPTLPEKMPYSPYRNLPKMEKLPFRPLSNGLPSPTPMNY